MPRDSSATRAKLVREAERLFATRGVHQVTVKEITEAAGQRNVSALGYHFGSREGLLRTILLAHGGPVDEGRGRHLAGLGEGATTRELVGALLLPYAERLASPEGRDYLRIVAQLTGAFPDWRDDDELRPPNLRRILALLEARPPGVPVEVRRERVVGVILLMTAAFAERARQAGSRRGPATDETTFLANLADMIVGALEAPTGDPLPPAVA